MDMTRIKFHLRLPHLSLGHPHMQYTTHAKHTAHINVAAKHFWMLICSGKEAGMTSGKPCS